MRTDKLNTSNELGMRPARPSDSGFIESLYRSTREDLRLIDAEDDFIETLITMQQLAQTVGYGNLFPNAMTFIVEKQGESIGRVMVDFGHNEVRLIDIAFIPLARGKGYGETVIRNLQLAAAQAKAPLVLTAMKNNPAAKSLYLRLGFQVEEATDAYERMAWYPQQGGTLIFT